MMKIITIEFTGHLENLKHKNNMPTRSTIAIEFEDGTIKSVYCHNDGYREGVGYNLEKRFPNGTDPNIIEEFIDEGDRSTMDMSYKEWRNENNPPTKYATVEKYLDHMYAVAYLYAKEGFWLYQEYGDYELRPL